MKDSTPESSKETKKKKIRRTDLAFNPFTSTLSEKQIMNLTEQEAQLSASDRLVFETAEKKNAVESYVYDMRSKLSESLVGFITEKDRETFVNLLQTTEDWLYNEGDEQTKSVYVAKLDELKALGDPVVRRKKEADERPYAIKEVKQAILAHKLTATSVDPKYEHIPPEERQKIVKKCEELENEINTLIGKQESLPKHVDPIFSSADLIKKKQELEAFANPIMNKPKPAPPKPEPKKEEPKKEESSQKPPENQKPETEQGSKMDEEQKPNQDKKNEGQMDLD